MAALTVADPVTVDTLLKLKEQAFFFLLLEKELMWPKQRGLWVCAWFNAKCLFLWGLFCFFFHLYHPEPGTLPAELLESSHLWALSSGPVATLALSPDPLPRLVTCSCNDRHIPSMHQQQAIFD